MFLVENKKVHHKTITITKAKQPNQQILKELSTYIIAETTTKIIVRLPSFFKTTQVLRKLQKAGIHSEFTARKLIKEFFN